MKRAFLILGIVVVCFLGWSYFRLTELNKTDPRVYTYSDAEARQIYAIGILMAGFGYLFSPEAAKEHFGLMIERQGKSIADMKSGYFQNSSVVLRAKEKACDSRSVQPLRWNMSSYEIKFEYHLYAEARIALALNGGRLDCSSGVPTIYVDITYPRYSMATFLQIQGVPLIQIQEGLFYELIDRGWYFPYTARYVISRQS